MHSLIRAFGALLYLLVWLGNIAAWITHVVFCIQSYQLLLLVIGAIIFPIGIVHGWGLWFGVF